MFDSRPNPHLPGASALVIGAGVGGLASALRLQASGMQVTVFESHDWPGGKMRALASDAGPVDAGPTVLTMRHVFDDLFHTAGTRLDDHVTLIREPLLARHFWPDGETLDLSDDPVANAEAIEAFAGKRAKAEFLRFSDETRELFDLFDGPMMQAAEPSLPALAKTTLSAPRHLPTLSPLRTMTHQLSKRFSDRQLAQLFGRYATYVGGTPLQSPALLILIWQAEARGVWRVQGGMHRLPYALAELFQALGGTLRLGTQVARINATQQVTGITLGDGTDVSADYVVFCGDPRALATGLLGPDAIKAATQTKTAPRSLSANVWSFAARVTGDPGLAHHNVFFGRDPHEEFTSLRAGRMPKDPNIYVCAEDRGSDHAPPDRPERFEIILNAAPLTLRDTNEEDQCHRRTFQTLARFGLRFDPVPGLSALTTPRMFDRMFPASAGALYGQSPHGMTAALKRPRAKTAIPGLYLAGGGTHPGAGVPMAALSGRHAAEAILKDLVST
ncbi:MAG: 1-hydroxycarotenoid 3,4-desaturase CrtD [Pseudomonadota bacterium]